jgi:6-pyruvoyltetrahydropterin/6-carboxytetrahydropterin synthase
MHDLRRRLSLVACKDGPAGAGALAAGDDGTVVTAPQAPPIFRSNPMTVLVGRRESFNAAHQLCDPDLSDEENRQLFGKCTNLHGHNYVLEVVVAGEVDQASGYVLDLKLLSDVMSRQVIRDVDHRNLNTDVPWLKGRIPTTENLALTFWERLRPELPAGLLRSVRVWETDKNWAEVSDQA